MYTLLSFFVETYVKDQELTPDQLFYYSPRMYKNIFILKGSPFNMKILFYAGLLVEEDPG